MTQLLRVDEVLWLIVDVPEELESPQGSKSKVDLSLIYQIDPKALPKELVDVGWRPKAQRELFDPDDRRWIE